MILRWGALPCCPPPGCCWHEYIFWKHCMSFSLKCHSTGGQNRCMLSMHIYTHIHCLRLGLDMRLLLACSCFYNLICVKSNEIALGLFLFFFPFCEHPQFPDINLQLKAYANTPTRIHTCILVLPWFLGLAPAMLPLLTNVYYALQAALGLCCTHSCPKR